MRSLLMVSSGDDLDAALACAADVLVIGIDDGAAADRHKRARERLEHARTRHPRASLFVAVHRHEGGAADIDLDALMPARPDGIVAEARSGADVQHLSIKLSVREAQLGLPDGSTKIIATAASTPASIFMLGSFCDASPRLAGLIFGGTSDSLGEGPAHTARSLMVLAAKSAGVPAFDAPSPDVGSRGLSEICQAALRDGFAGKCADAADQVATINAVFGAAS